MYVVSESSLSSPATRPRCRPHSPPPMAAVLAATPPQPIPKAPSPTLPLSSTAIHRLPSTPYRRATKPLHSSPPPSDWPWEQRLQESLAVLDLMESQSIPPDSALFCTLLKGCADARSPRFGRIVHDRVLHSGLLSDPLVANSLVLMYARCGQLETARQVFDDMPVKTVISWTTAISMYHHAGFPHDALDLYRSMMAASRGGGCRPNAFTYTIALNSCASVGDIELGREIHEDVIRDGCDRDEFVVVALIDMYAKCSCVDDARLVFDKISEPSVEACTAMVEGYTANGDGRVAMDIVRRVLRSGTDAEVAGKLGLTTIIRPCVMELALRQGQEIHAHIVKLGHKFGMKTLHLLADLYEKCDKVIEASQLLDGLVAKDVYLWGRIVSGFVRIGLYTEALKFYADMACSDSGLNPSVLCSALEACAGLSGLEEGRQIHGHVIKVRHLFSRGSVLDGLVELYRSCGEDEEAYKLTKQLTSMAVRSVDVNLTRGPVQT